MKALFEMTMYLVPMLFLGLVFLYLISQYFKEETARRYEEMRQRTRENIAPQRLQAYERMALFLERIRPSNLARRVELVTDATAYEYALVNTIQQEFEHNLSQQIYVSPETWKIIFSAKNATQNFIKQCRESVGQAASSEALRDEILRKSVDGGEPSGAAILQIQGDVQGFS